MKVYAVMKDCALWDTYSGFGEGSCSNETALAEIFSTRESAINFIKGYDVTNDQDWPFISEKLIEVGLDREDIPKNLNPIRAWVWETDDEGATLYMYILEKEVLQCLTKHLIIFS